jgi:hypothetical protein
MALIHCKECSKEISDLASACPHCGYPLTDEESEEESNKESSSKGWIMIALLFVVGAAVYFYETLPHDGQKLVKEAFNQVTNQPVTLYEKQYQLQEDQYFGLPIELTVAADVTIEYTVMSGPNLDVFFVSTDDYYRWQRMVSQGASESDFRYYTDLSTFGTSISSNTVRFNEGKYYIILDNTDYGPTYPPMNFENDVSTIKLKIIKE